MFFWYTMCVDRINVIRCGELNIRIVGDKLMVYELEVSVHVNDDVHFTKSLGELGEWLNRSFLRDESLKELHGSIGYKGYVFSNLMKGEKNGVYKRGYVYRWLIRGVSKELLVSIQRVLKDERGGMFTYVSGSVKSFDVTNRGLIEKLKTLNPIILNDMGIRHEDFDVLGVKRALEGNIEKKYRKFIGGDVRGHEFISRIDVVSRKPMGLSYKGVKLLGLQYEIYVKEDALSQAYAELAMMAGLGEKNSALGAGFVNAKLYEMC